MLARSGTTPGDVSHCPQDRPEAEGDTPVPAVVVGGTDNGGGLGLVRSLGRADVPVIVVDCEASAPALHSRYARRIVVPELSGTSLVKELLALRAAIPCRPVLFLTSDEAVLTVSQYRDVLEPAYRFRLPRHDRLTSLMDKNSFQALAESYGFPVPRSVRIRSVDEIGELARLIFPIVIKPSVKSDAYLKTQFARGYRTASLQHAESLCRRILPVQPDLIVQEWIEGADSEIFFCLQYRGDAGQVCSFTGRKLSIWPTDVGTTASCTAAPDVHPVLAKMTEAFFQATSFVGMGSMEFKRDVRTGRFLMIEPTVGRVDWQEEVATLHGVNIPFAAYRYEIQADLPPTPEEIVPVVWRDTGRHWKVVRAGHAPGNSRPKAKVFDAYWRLDDPLPAVFHVLSTLIRILRRVLKRIEKPRPIL